MSSERDPLLHVKLLRRLISFDTTNDPMHGRKPTHHCPDYLCDRLEVRMGPAFMHTSHDSRLVRTARKVAKQLGLEETVEMAGATDTRHFADGPVEAIDYGPLGGNVHGPNEYVLLESIPRTATFYTHLVRSLHHKRE